MASRTAAWSSGWIEAINWSSSPWISTGPSTPKIAAFRLSQKTVPVRRSRSQMPTEPASRATSSRASVVPTADRAAESSSSATTEADSCSRSSAASADQFLGPGS